MRLGSGIEANPPCRNGAAARIARRKLILDLIAERRNREGDPAIGASIERYIIADELARVEAECVIGS